MRTNTPTLEQILLILFSTHLFISATHAQAELRIDFVSHNLVQIGSSTEITIYGEGFDENTRVSMALDTGNRSKLVGSADTPGLAQDITISGITAYMADYDAGLQVIDIGDPTRPYIAGSVDTPGYARGIAVSGNMAYHSDQVAPRSSELK